MTKIWTKLDKRSTSGSMTITVDPLLFYCYKRLVVYCDENDFV